MAVSTKKRLSLEEIIQSYSLMSFDEFRATSEIRFDNRFHEWSLTNFQYDNFHFFSRKIAESETEKVFLQGYDYLQTITAHNEMNICGVFLNPEEVEIFSIKNSRIYATVRVIKSEILNRWFWGASYSYGNGGGGMPCSISENEDVNQIYSGESRAECLVKATEWIYPSFSRAAEMPEDKRQKCLKELENFIGQSVSQTTLPIPEMLKSNGIAIQGSLF